MSLSDLQKQVNNSGIKTFTEQHDKIMKEGVEHRAMLEKQEQSKFAKDMKAVQKGLKDVKGRLPNH